MRRPLSLSWSRLMSSHVVFQLKSWTSVLLPKGMEGQGVKDHQGEFMPGLLREFSSVPQCARPRAMDVTPKQQLYRGQAINVTHGTKDAGAEVWFSRKDLEVIDGPYDDNQLITEALNGAQFAMSLEEWLNSTKDSPNQLERKLE